MEQARQLDAIEIGVRKIENRRCPARQRRDTPRMSQGKGGLQIDEIRQHQRHLAQVIGRNRAHRLRFGVEHRVEQRVSTRRAGYHVRRVEESPDDGRIELPSRALGKDAACQCLAARQAHEHRRSLRHRKHTRHDGERFTRLPLR
ncbi:MAG: hypothetical protein EXR28_11980 [Betaproteobacteria bacterium]|nr:hypothetical protein [Betaproteobacteria bacterium]